MPGKIGDALFATSSVRHIKKIWSAKEKDVEIDWVYGPDLIDFVPKCLMHTDLPVSRYIPYEHHHVRHVVDGAGWKTMDWHIEMPGYDLYYNLTLDTCPEPGCHLVEWIARGEGLIEPGQMLPNPFLSFKHPPKFSAKDKILVHPWIPFPERQWQELMSLRSEYGGYKVCNIGLLNEPAVPGAEDLGGTPYEVYIDFLRTAKLVVGVCSSSVVLAASFGTPSLMVHNITSPLNAGVSRFGPKMFDLCRPKLYDIEHTIHELLSM